MVTARVGAACYWDVRGREGRAMIEEGLFGFCWPSVLACVRACVCVCVNWEMFKVDSAIQRAFVFKLRAK